MINGQRRPIAEEDNSWAAKNDGKQWINLLISPTKVKEIRIVFDSDLNAEITQTLSDWIKERQPVGLPKTLN